MKEWRYRNIMLMCADRILDTHIGSGNSAIAAYECNHPCLGIEINQEYFNKAVERIDKHIATRPKII